MENKGIVRGLKLGYLLLTVLLVLGIGIGAAVSQENNNISGLTVNPNPIRIGSTTTIGYSLAQSSYVTVKVFTESGGLIRTVVNNVYRNAGSVSQTWDTKDASGIYVPDGNYRFLVEAKDKDSILIGEAEKTQLAARVPAISEVTDSPDPVNHIGGQQVTINYTLSADALVTVTILQGATQVRALKTSELVYAGSRSIVWDGKNNAANFVGDGSYTYQIDAVSPTYSPFKSTYKSTVTVASIAPEITNFTVSPDPLKLISSHLSIVYTLSETATVQLNVFDQNGSLVKKVLDGVSKPAGSNNTVWDGKDTNGNYVPEGQYTVKLEAIDASGMSSGIQSKTLTAGYLPTASAATMTPNPYNPNADGTQAVIGYTLSQDALVKVQILNGGVSVRGLLNQQQSKGNQTLSWDGKDDAGNILGDGAYTCQLTAASPTVASFNSILKFTATIEKEAPSITDFSLSPAPYKIGTNLSVRYTLSESASVSINVFQGQQLIREVLKDSVRRAGYNSAVWDGLDQSGALVGEGTYNVVVTAVDPFNKIAEVSGIVSAGIQSTVSEMSATPNPFNPGADIQTTIGFNLSSAARVTLKILNGGIPVRTIVSDTLMQQGANQVTWDGKDDNAQYVNDGQYTYQIEAVSPNVATIKSTYKGNLTVETQPPVLTELFVGSGIARIGTNSTMGYTVSEPVTVTVQILNSQGQVIRNFPTAEKTQGGRYTLNWDTKDDLGNLVVSGSYKLKVIAVDKFDKSSTAELAFLANRVPIVSNAAANPGFVDLSQSVINTTISFNLSENSYVTVNVFDPTNKLWKSALSNIEKPAGQVSVSLNVYEKGQPKVGTYTFNISARSVVGNFVSTPVSNTFEISGTLPDQGSLPPPPPPPAPLNCSQCHPTFPVSHPVTNCNGCHGGDQPILDCRACHEGVTHGPEKVAMYNCEYCHNTTYSYKIPVHPANLDPFHTATLAINCQNCHNNVLNVEHPKHTDAAGRAYDCNTCHASTDQTVQQAVYNKDTNCSTCHSSAGHEAMHIAPLGTDCQQCHSNVLSVEHPKHTNDAGIPYSCSTCHDSTNQTVQQAVYNKVKNCSACHSSASHGELHVTTVLDDKCTTCHINSLTDEHLANPKSQIRTDSNGNPVVLTCATCHQSTNQKVIGAIATANKQCAACHSVAHNLSISENVAADIPVYSAVYWSSPIDASIFAGESWMPTEYLVGGKVVISSRSKTITGDAVFNYYQQQMSLNSWNLVSTAPAPGIDFFTVTYEKGTHKAMIWFYGGSAHNASPVLEAGYRIEIIYK
jgi:flagellar hook assembly protein FlgD